MDMKFIKDHWIELVVIIIPIIAGTIGVTYNVLDSLIIRMKDDRIGSLEKSLFDANNIVSKLERQEVSMRSSINLCEKEKNNIDREIRILKTVSTDRTIKLGCEKYIAEVNNLNLITSRLEARVATNDETKKQQDEIIRSCQAMSSKLSTDLRGNLFAVNQGKKELIECKKKLEEERLSYKKALEFSKNTNIIPTNTIGNIRHNFPELPVKLDQKYEGPQYRDQGFVFTLQECKGKSRIACTIMVRNIEEDRILSIWGKYRGEYSSIAYDNSGNEYLATRVKIGNKAHRNLVEMRVIKNVPVRATVYFDGFTDAPSLSLLEVKYSLDGQKVWFMSKFRNIKLIN